MNSLPTKQDADTVEQLIDRIGLAETLNLVAAICAEKAEHLRSNWQDNTAAREWDKSGARVSELADNPVIQGCG